MQLREGGVVVALLLCGSGMEAVWGQREDGVGVAQGLHLR